MRLGIRLLFGFFLVTGLAAFFVLRVFMVEVKPSVREVMEDMMVDTANVLAVLAAPDLASGRMAQGRFAEQVRTYPSRVVDAKIWGLSKTSLDYRVYVTDTQGRVVFDSATGAGNATGQDYSRWRDVYLTLRGEYGARATREVLHDDSSSIMYVAAPVMQGAQIIGVLTVAKPMASVQAFAERAERKILWSGVLLLVLSLAIGVLVTLWVVWSIRKLRHYARGVAAGATPSVPQIPGELGELAQAMDAMRRQLEGRQYIESYVRALTHELKSPLAAIRGAGELLQDDLPESARREFAGHVLGQTERLQTLVDRLLELTKLEQRHAMLQPQAIAMREFLERFVRQTHAGHAQAAIKIIVSEVQDCPLVMHAEPDLLALALSNLLENARAFAPADSTVYLEAGPGWVAVQDAGPGVPDFALARLGERFFSTPRPDGLSKGSGLGLAIVQQIMVLHGGRMVVRNTSPGLRVELHF